VHVTWNFVKDIVCEREMDPTFPIFDFGIWRPSQTIMNRSYVLVWILYIIVISIDLYLFFENVSCAQGALVLPWAKSIQTTPSTSNGAVSGGFVKCSLQLCTFYKNPLTQHRWMCRVWSGLILLMGAAGLLAHKIRHPIFYSRRNARACN
jgi:hypothetical protein